MIPIRDHNPSRNPPYVTIALIAINVLVFLSYAALLSDQRATEAFFAQYALIPARLAHGDGYYTLISSMFMHGGLMHLAGNMLFLWIFGDNLEDEFGHLGFLAFYLLSGLAAAFTQILANPASPVPMVGASGAIAGVMGGYLLLFPRARVDVLFIFVIFVSVIAVPAWVVLVFWFVVQLFSGVGSVSIGAEGGVAYWAHAGGFLAGFLMAMPVWLRLGGQGFWERTHGKPPYPETTYYTVPSGVPRVRRRR